MVFKKTKIKICGITNISDLNELLKWPVDYIGFINAKSKRKVPVSQIKKIWTSLKKPLLHKKVIVFVNKPIKEAIIIVNKLKPDLVQLHGEETPIYINTLKDQTKTKIIKAFRIDTGRSLILDGKKMNENEFKKKINRYSNIVDFFLFDKYSDKSYGGTGLSIDIKNIEILNEYKSYSFIAGGINPDNIKAFIDLGFYGLDISSGIELYAGKKDNNKIAKLFNKLEKIV